VIRILQKHHNNSYKERAYYKIKMKVRLLSETYTIEGGGHSGLIPPKTQSASIEYLDNGDIKSIFYHDGVGESDEIKSMNARKQTPEEMKRVVGLLKKLA